MAAGFIFGADGLPKTPQELAQMREIAKAMRGTRNPRTVGEGLASLGEGIGAGIILRQANNAERKGREGASNAFSAIVNAMGGGGGAASAAPAGGTGVSYSGSIPAADLETDPNNRRVNQGWAAFGDVNAPENWAQIREGIFAGESKGDYDALFGFSNRPGGKFADTKLTDMTVDEALAFSDPSGPYGQWVKGKVGRVATPMGGYQVVGTTLRAAKDQMGLRGDEKMTPELQERIGQHIYKTQGTGAWKGYKGPMEPSGQYASLNPSIAPMQPAIDPKAVLAQKLTKMQGGNVSANPVAEVPQAAQGVDPLAHAKPQVAAALQNAPGALPQTAPQQALSGAQRVAQAMPQGGMDQQTMQIIQAINNPYMPAGERAVLGAMLQQRQQANDPMRQMQLEKGRLELEQMRNPTTDDIKEYNLAKSQGYEGSFFDYVSGMKKAGAQNITVGGGKYGTIPPGFELIETGQGAMLRPLPGGPAALEAQKLADAKDAAQTSKARSGNVVLEDIDRALKGLDEGYLPTTGALGGALSNLPGTQAYDVGQLIETVKANSGFDRLQAMRDASPTGGALGAINQSEMGLLQAALGNLSQSQGEEQLRYNLQRVRRIYDEIVNGPRGSSVERAGRGDEFLKNKAPQGVEQSTWDAMTPEEKALWN